MISIALAVIVNLITLAVVTGFQQEVRQKVKGFGSHIFIMTASDYSIYESAPIRKDQEFVAEVKAMKGVHSIQAVGYKPVLFQSRKEEVKYQLPNGKDTSEIQQNVFGTVIKGVEDSYDWSFFKEHLLKGEIPQFGTEKSNKILVSKKLSNDLHFEVGDTVGAFFVRNMPVKQHFVISGIYETGLEEFDKKFVLGDLRFVQELNDWGIHANLELQDSLIDGTYITIVANVTGGNGHYRYNWGNGFGATTGHRFCPTNDTTFRLVASDYNASFRESIASTTLPDTAYVKITIEGNPNSPCDFETDGTGALIREYLNDSGSKFRLKGSQKSIVLEFTSGKGTSQNYAGGFEVNVDNWDDLEQIHAAIKKKVEFFSSAFNEQFKVTSIKKNEQDIFVWLGFLDINVIIIVVLMIIIGIINMGSALLVLILIRSNFIGILKSMGATNWKIQKIFLIQAGFLIGRGMLVGNAIGLSICYLQSTYGIVPLDPEVYYLTQVPIEINWMHWLLLNIGTLVVCLVALIAPSRVIMRITPVKAIKFN